MAEREVYLVVKGVERHYGEGEVRVKVLRGIDCTITKGEMKSEALYGIE